MTEKEVKKLIRRQLRRLVEVMRKHKRHRAMRHAIIEALYNDSWKWR